MISNELELSRLRQEHSKIMKWLRKSDDLTEIKDYLNYLEDILCRYVDSLDRIFKLQSLNKMEGL